MNISNHRPAVLLDRDGVINRNRGDYVKSWEEFEFLPRSLEALRVIPAGSEFALDIEEDLLLEFELAPA